MLLKVKKIFQGKFSSRWTENEKQILRTTHVYDKAERVKLLLLEKTKVKRQRLSFSPVSSRIFSAR